MVEVKDYLSQSEQTLQPLLIQICELNETVPQSVNSLKVDDV